MQTNPDKTALDDIIRHNKQSVRYDGGPVTRMLGTHIEWINPAVGTGEFTFNLGTDFTNDNGVIMGGIVTFMMDLAMASVVMARTKPNHSVATTNLQIQFFRPCLPGKLFALAEIVKDGKKLCFCECTLFDGNRKKLSSSTSTNLIMLNEKSH